MSFMVVNSVLVKSLYAFNVRYNKDIAKRILDILFYKYSVLFDSNNSSKNVL